MFCEVFGDTRFNFFESDLGWEKFLNYAEMAVGIEKFFGCISEKSIVRKSNDGTMFAFGSQQFCDLAAIVSRIEG
ncbi:MAG: hypothetical protein LBL39_04605 [Planctomycetaceae bacterium]|nr:hypothetical protein [Planctomycetaceae bacterium]